MTEDFDTLKKRLAATDPGLDAPVLSAALVAAAPNASRNKAPLGKRFRQLTISSSLLASAGAFALVVSLALPQEPLIRMSATGAGNTTMAASEAAVGDAKMIWPGYIQYEYDTEALSGDTGRGKVYQLQLSGNAEEKLLAVAKLFGISGEVKAQEWSSPDYPAFSIGTENESVGVTWAGTGNWYYSFWDESSFRCENKIVELENGESYESCEPILTPELIPDTETMRAEAVRVFSELGMEVSADQIRVSRNDWGGYANVSMQIDGLDTALESGLSWDGSGRLNYAFGHFAEVVERGEFDTVSAKEAADRIKDGRWYGAAASSLYTFDAQPIARSTDIAVEPAPAEAVAPEAEAETLPAPEATLVPAEPEIVTLKLVDSESALLLIYDQSGSAWLVPGYLLTNDQGWFDSIISLVEGVIELPEPTKFDILPMPAEDAPATKQG